MKLIFNRIIYFIPFEIVPILCNTHVVPLFTFRKSMKVMVFSSSSVNFLL